MSLVAFLLSVAAISLSGVLMPGPVFAVAVAKGHRSPAAGLKIAIGHGIVEFLLQLGRPFGSLSNGEVTPYAVAGVLLAQPLIALYRLLLYVDVRTRLEGWDLQVSLRALGMER